MNRPLQVTPVGGKEISRGLVRQVDDYPNLFANFQYDTRPAHIDLECTASPLDGQASFYNEISTLMSIEPLIPEHDTLVDTTNSTTFWPASIDGSRAFNREAKTCTSIQTCALPLTQRSHSNSIPSTNGAGPSAVDSQQWTKGFSSANTEEQPLWIQACELGTMIDGSVTSVSPTESKKTRRARHAANQRHKKARKACKEKFKDQSSGKAATGAAEREQQRREMNKVAAAKCRLRQRKQVQTIQEKAS